MMTRQACSVVTIRRQVHRQSSVRGREEIEVEEVMRWGRKGDAASTAAPTDPAARSNSPVPARAVPPAAAANSAEVAAAAAAAAAAGAEGKQAGTGPEGSGQSTDSDPEGSHTTESSLEGASTNPINPGADSQKERGEGQVLIPPKPDPTSSTSSPSTATTAASAAAAIASRSFSSHLSSSPSALSTPIRSCISCLTALEHLSELASSPPPPPPSPLSITDLLYSYGCVGVALRVQRSESSAVNPYNLVVSWVSTDYVDAAAMMCLMDAEVEWKDAYGQEVSDVVIVPEPHCTQAYLWFIRSKLYTAYLATVFTRNPALAVPAQRSALMIIAMSRAIEQLMDWGRAYQISIQLQGQKQQQPFSSSLSPPSPLAGAVAPLSPSLSASPLLPAPSSPFLSSSPPSSPSLPPSSASSSSPSSCSLQAIMNALAPASAATPQAICKLVTVILNMLFHVRHTTMKPMKEGGPGENGEEEEGVQPAASSSSFYHSVVSKLYLPHPSQHMTEAASSSIISCVQLLIPLIALPSASPLFLSPSLSSQRREVFLSLLAEAVSRATRMKVKLTQKPNQTSQQAAFRILQRALGITRESSVQCRADGEQEPELETLTFSRKWDRMQARGKSGKFFSRAWTNCSPRSVVAALGFAAAVHQYEAEHGECSVTDHLLSPSTHRTVVAHLASAMQSVSMSSFISTVYPDLDPMLVQIALFVSGIRYHNSTLRRNGMGTGGEEGEGNTITQPERVIESIAAECRRELYLEMKREKVLRLTLARLAAGANARRERLLLQQSEFLATHTGAPQLFTPDQVAELNRHRPLHDQLELLPNGLLKHHCTFPQCPEYLVNQSREEDRVVGAAAVAAGVVVGSHRRRGLFRHLRWFMLPSNYLYEAATHLEAASVLRRERMGEDEFVCHMMKMSDERGKRGEGRKGASREERQAFFRCVYRSIHSIWPYQSGCSDSLK